MKIKREQLVILLIIGLIFPLMINNTINFSDEQKSTEINPKSSQIYNGIKIDALATTNTTYSGNWTWAVNQPWCYNDTGIFIIENVTIDASSSPTGSGIFINNSKNDYFIIRNCTVYNAGTTSNDAGIKLENTCNGTIFNNNCSNNGQYGIYLYDNCKNNTISNNTLNYNNQHGIRLNMLCEFNNITGNTAKNNAMYGIDIFDNCHNNSISGNTLNSNEYYGLNMYYCDDNNITGNIVNYNTRHGLYFYDSYWNNITKNIVNENILIGIHLRYNSDNNTIKNNTINRNDVGIVLYSSDYNNITENILKDNNWCIFESYCNGNNISENNDCSPPTVQTPIFIDGTATGVGAHNWTWVQQQNWFGGGSGTKEVPFIIENLKISGFGFSVLNGIEIKNSNVFFIIRGCVIYNSLSGTYLENVNNSLLIDNNCSNNSDAGIFLENDCYYNNITKNTLNANSIGIYLTYCGYNNITGNTATGNTYNGIFLESHNDYNIIMGNIFNDNSDGIEIYEESDFNQVVGNTANHNEYSGITIEQSDKNVIMGNVADNNTVYGIEIHESSYNNNITGNTANGNNEEGIYLYDYCINNTIAGNIANNNYRGLTIGTSSEYNTISENTLNNNEEGIFLTSDCYNNTISDNIINSIYKGIALATACQDNTISGNTIELCGEQGIKLSEGCDNNEFTDNVLYNNTLGIEITDGSDNSFYRNFFIKNGKHANDGGTNTAWNSTTIGNYWDNHTSPDANNDGIVDNPYMYIGGSMGSIDFLPIAEDGAPQITINSPITNEVLGATSPSFDITITEDYLDLMWYTLDGGLHNYTFIENEIINQSAWDAMADGTITLTFYARDIPRNIGSTGVNIIKDTIVPIIIINSPVEGDRFGKNAPLFNITITEDNLDSIWYSFDGGAHIHFITNNSLFNQSAWAALSEGDITITFYARDLAGNEASESVTVIKSVPSGLDPGIIITIVIVSIVGGVAVISVVYIFMKKRTTP